MKSTNNSGRHGKVFTHSTATALDKSFSSLVRRRSSLWANLAAEVDLLRMSSTDGGEVFKMTKFDKY